MSINLFNVGLFVAGLLMQKLPKTAERFTLI